MRDIFKDFKLYYCVLLFSADMRSVSFDPAVSSVVVLAIGIRIMNFMTLKMII